MEFKVGDLVWLASTINEDLYYGPPAMIVAAYEDLPRIFLFNEKANKEWLEAEDIGIGGVYDILYNGGIEIAVSGEWLVSFDKVT
ncbi:MAG TPA: hypothetical protein EYQ00_08455 [Dehalococcoidia bacterium]|jgi:hypothetical protein|nr:hypothetical protein [Dehalococcoidia bacterium]